MLNVFKGAGALQGREVFKKKGKTLYMSHGICIAAVMCCADTKQAASR